MIFVAFVVYARLDRHLVNPAVMSRTVRINPLLALSSYWTGGAVGNWLGGTFGAFVVVLLAIPTAASLQIPVRASWLATLAEQARPAEAQGGRSIRLVLTREHAGLGGYLGPQAFI